ncbi:MAG: class II glutamine amidotransferase [Prevotellaceae bacterium]|jgi:amidophosphoribosyltransferase|nr:class II glutamine amidotransferase [Prevotellaceae bacterium]
MSDSVKHECGIAFIRLLKPLDYYKANYNTWRFGLHRICLMMEKQHNRGQDGAGVAALKLKSKCGYPYIDRERSDSKSPIRDVFDKIYDKIHKTKNYEDIDAGTDNIRFAGELYLGHVRYATHGKTTLENVHPVMRFNNWKARNLVLAGNFNLTNVDEIFKWLVAKGQHPRDMSDTVTVLERIGYELDREYAARQNDYVLKGYESGEEISRMIENNLDVVKILREATADFDGGYTIGGMIGNGDAFILRDPNGIRPAFYYAGEDFVAAASERPVLQTAFKLNVEDIKEIAPGNAMIVKKDGSCAEHQIRKSEKRASCSFERIYFSRGTDKFIYGERKTLGKQLIPAILKAIDYDLENTVLSYIPNTAETAFYGMLDGIEEFMTNEKMRKIAALKELTNKQLLEIIGSRPRVEKIAIKDVKLRTFITEDKARNGMVEHVYDVTYGVIRPYRDNLVIIDDSIVRGTTLKTSILRMLERLNPKKIVIVSSAPQIRYPDCYGIDMTRMTEFCAFRAAVELLRESGREQLLDDVYRKCKAQQKLPKEKIVNHVKEIYADFSDERISRKIAEMLRPNDMKAELELIFQTIEGVRNACPENNGDWYFSGNYPTPGGNRVVNNAYINYFEQRDVRPY